MDGRGYGNAPGQALWHPGGAGAWLRRRGGQSALDLPAQGEWLLCNWICRPRRGLPLPGRQPVAAG